MLSCPISPVANKGGSLRPLFRITISAFCLLAFSYSLHAGKIADVAVNEHPDRVVARESELLGTTFTPKIPNEIERQYVPFRDILFTNGTNCPFLVRIWKATVGGWPGSNCQIIEVLKDGKRMSSRKVGGEPAMVDAWGAITREARVSLFYVYILCRTRNHHWNAPGIYVYQIGPDFSISAQGIALTKEELEDEGELEPMPVADKTIFKIK